MEKVKWGVLGAAAIGESNVFEGMQQAVNCEMYAIASRSAEKAERFKEKYGFTKAYSNYDALLADPEVQAVYIPLPNHLHHEWSIKAMQHGKHVLCEKPLVANEQEAEELFFTAQRNHVHLMEAFAYLHSPFIKALQEEVKKGSIGKLYLIDSSFLIPTPSADNIRMRKEMLGGSVYDLGVYTCSLSLSLIDGEPNNVKAIASYNQDGIDLLSAAILEFDDGVKATMQCGMALADCGSTRFDRFVLHGTEGYITSSNFTFNGEGELHYSVHRYDGSVENKTIFCPQNYRLEVEQLGRCILDGESPTVTAEFSLRHMRVLDRILLAMEYAKQ